MLGAPCSPCCGCTQQKADELNAAIRAMTVHVAISQSNYVCQSGLFSSRNSYAAFAPDWNSPPDTVPTLARCRTTLDAEGYYLNTPGFLFAPEQQVSTSPYLLALDPSQNVPAFRYYDNHISIDLECFYQPAGEFLGGLPVANDDSRCNFQWDLRIFKRRWSGDASLASVIDFPVQEITYGPTDVGGKVAAAVARYRPYDYAVLSTTQVESAFPLRSVQALAQSYHKAVSIDSHPSYREFVNKLVFDLTDKGSASRQQNGGLTLTIPAMVRNNNSWAIFDRTTEDTNLQPRLVENPSYSLARLSSGQGDDRIRMQQTYSQISIKTVQQVSTPFTASCVVSLTP